MLKIYGRANSINVRKVLWVADEIGVAFEREDYGRGFKPTNDPAFRRVSRFGVIPVIDDDGYILRESNTITRYLAARHGRTDLLPTDLEARAIVEQWMDWATTDLTLHMRPVFLGHQLKMAPFDDPVAIERELKGWTHQMRLLDAELAERGPYLAGAAFTVADIPVGLAVHRWFSTSIARPDLPAVSAYYERLSKRPPFLKHGRNGTP